MRCSSTAPTPAPATRRLYAANLFAVVRQLHYGTKNDKSVDLVPTATRASRSSPTAAVSRTSR